MLIKILNLEKLVLVGLILLVSTFFIKSEELVIEIDNPKFSEKGLDDNIYEIKAKKGFKSDNKLELHIIEGKFKTEKNGKWIYLEADEGNFHQAKNIIELKKNIIFYTDDGEKIRSNYATFDMSNDIIKLKDSVSHESIEGIILSESSVISDNFNKIIYAGNVKSIMKNID